MTKWINIHDEQPPLGDWVLALCKAPGSHKNLGRGIYTVRRIAEGDAYDPVKWLLPYYMHESAILTHWMPMPEMPDDMD